MPPSSPKRELVAALGLVDDRPIVALLPGSRRNEVTATLPTLVDGVRLIRTQLPSAQVVVARAPKLSSDLFAPVDRLAKPAIVVDGRADDVLAVADIALVASGTVTVQAALHECPMVVVYRLSPLTFRLGRPLRSRRYVCDGESGCGSRSCQSLSSRTSRPTPSRVKRSRISPIRPMPRVRDELREVRSRLGAPGASQRPFMRCSR